MAPDTFEDHDSAQTTPLRLPFFFCFDPQKMLRRFDTSTDMNLEAQKQTVQEFIFNVKKIGDGNFVIWSTMPRSCLRPSSKAEAKLILTTSASSGKSLLSSIPTPVMTPTVSHRPGTSPHKSTLGRAGNETKDQQSSADDMKEPKTTTIVQDAQNALKPKTIKRVSPRNTRPETRRIRCPRHQEVSVDKC